MLSENIDLFLPFQLESSSLRGRVVRLGNVLDIILHQHAYPDQVAYLLAEAMVIAATLASALKFEGVFTLQTKTDGPVRMLVADVNHAGGVRAYAQYDKDKLSDVPVNKLLGKGYLAFTCALTGRDDRYQGIVELTGGASLAEAVQHYFKQSEQIPTGIAVAVRKDDQDRWYGGGLLLQRMPREGGYGSNVIRFPFNVEAASPEAEDWTRAMLVMGTCTPEELTDPFLPPETLLFRLFHEEGVRVYDGQALHHQCRCSQPKVEAMLRALPRDQIDDLVVDGMMTVTCEFCNKTYAYDEKARAELFSSLTGG